MRECDRLFKHYCNENNPTLTVANIANTKKLETQLYSKSKYQKKNIIRIIFKYIQKMLKQNGDGIKSIVTLQSKGKTL